MADFSMFGPAQGGARLFEEDQAANSVRLLNAMGTASQIQERDQLNKYRQQEMQQRAQTMQQQQIQLQRENALRARMAQIAQEEEAANPGSSKPVSGTNAVSPSQKPMAISERLSDIGMKIFTDFPAEGISLLEKADQAFQKEQQAGKESADRDKAITEQQLKINGLVAGAYRDVKDQQGKAIADNIIQATTGRPSPYANAPYSPELIDYVNNSAVSAKDKSLMDYRKREADLKASSTASANALRDSARQVNVQRKDWFEARTTAMAKDGKVVNKPDKDEMEHARKFALDQLGIKDEADLDEVSKQSFEQGVLYLASTAKEVRTAKRGVGESQSLSKAFNPSDWQMLQKKDILAGKLHAQAHFIKGGKTPTEAVPAPTEASARDDGRWYSLPNGKIGQWTKAGWVSVQDPIKEPGRPDTAGLNEDERSDAGEDKE